MPFIEDMRSKQRLSVGKQPPMIVIALESGRLVQHNNTKVVQAFSATNNEKCTSKYTLDESGEKYKLTDETVYGRKPPEPFKIINVFAPRGTSSINVLANDGKQSFPLQLTDIVVAGDGGSSWLYKPDTMLPRVPSGDPHFQSKLQFRL